MSKKSRILFIYWPFTSFIQNDLELLRKYFEVKPLQLRGKNLRGLFWFTLRIFKDILQTDVTFSWFADLHAAIAVLFSKIFHKKSIVVVAGYDVAKIPELNYGLALNPIVAPIVKFTIEKADKVLVVDAALKKDAMKNIGANGNNIQILPTGFDHRKFKPEGEKENLVITVSTGDNWRRVQLKGLDTFVKSAKFLSVVKFLIIGIQKEALKKLKTIAPSNVEFINQIPQDRLISYYQKAKVYCQLSLREGLPTALCEAMLCECVPVGTFVQGVKTVITNDVGFFVPYGDHEATVKAIKKASNSLGKGKFARERIKNLFPIENREKELVRIIHSLCLPNSNKLG